MERRQFKGSKTSYYNNQGKHSWREIIITLGFEGLKRLDFTGEKRNEALCVYYD